MMVSHISVKAAIRSGWREQVMSSVEGANLMYIIFSTPAADVMTPPPSNKQSPAFRFQETSRFQKTVIG